MYLDTWFDGGIRRKSPTIKLATLEIEKGTTLGLLSRVDLYLSSAIPSLGPSRCRFSWSLDFYPF